MVSTTFYRFLVYISLPVFNEEQLEEVSRMVKKDLTFIKEKKEMFGDISKLISDYEEVINLINKEILKRAKNLNKILG